MTHTITLSDYEANLIERALRRQTQQMSDVDLVTVERIADRLLRRLTVGRGGRSAAIHADVCAFMDQAGDNAFQPHPAMTYMFATGDQDFLSADDNTRRWAVVPPPSTRPIRIRGTSHNLRREGDEYACSCGARWDVSDGEAHP